MSHEGKIVINCTSRDAISTNRMHTFRDEV